MEPGYSVPACTVLLLADKIHLDTVPLVNPYPDGIERPVAPNCPKFPRINLLPAVILTLPVVKIKLPFILTPSASQITFGEAVAVLVTSKFAKTLATLLLLFTPAAEPPKKPAESTVTV